MQSAAIQREQKALLLKLKRLVVRSHGATGVKELSNCFRLADDDDSLHLDREEFASCLRTFGLQLSEAELDSLVRLFDIDGDGLIGVSEFLSVFRVGLNPKRKAFIERAFAKFDQNGDGKLSLEELKRAYQAHAHPDVQKGARTEEEVLEAFLTDFDSNKDGFVSKQEFEQRYSGMSAGIAHDDEFIELLCLTWNLDDVPMHAANRIPTSHMSIEGREGSIARVLALQRAEDVATRLRKCINEKMALKVHHFARELRKHDPARSGYISMEGFGATIRECLLHYSLSSEDVNILFEGFDTRGVGQLDYLSLLHTLAGDLPPRRLMALERTWRLFPKDKRGLVPVRYLHEHYTADYIPDVATGRIGKGRGLSDFYTYWDMGHYPQGAVDFTEFALYYQTVGEAVVEDAHFETMLKVSWSVWQQEREQLIAALG